MAVVLGRAEDIRTVKLLERNPACGSDFPVWNQRFLPGDPEHEGPHHDRRQDRRARGQVIEPAKKGSTGEDDPDFLESLPFRGGLKIAIGRGRPAAGQRDMSRPHIAIPLRPSNEQDRIGVGREHQRDRCAGPLAGGLLRWSVTGEPAGQLGEIAISRRRDLASGRDNPPAAPR